ncbi:thiamine biosynthetic bifunctional enzyme [Ephemerocybe angulata]|uniref:hydroxyethylthiazole kinase n=1 Tax=Ephemerocybe angulata TaxID=980116 RepID=A0A8H6IDS9_9AGAR|nr:thiamine biosynthetic bifunctional enzyme [Tulosesus angulatus]
MEIDYSVYLVTGRDLLPPGKSYLESLEESIRGGVTVVQVREKDADTGEFIQIAAQSKEVCDRYKIPLIINDRVDPSGVHVGQDDMDVELVRKLLPPGSVIGLSLQHLGVGLCGIKTSNLWRTLYGGVSVTGHALDGVAVVSEIVASQDPRGVANSLSKIVKDLQISTRASELISKTRDISPLVHQITNNVVATQSANVTLAVGASPIMATEPEEMEDLSKICGALLVNIGTMRADGLEGMRLAGRYANKYRKPIVFDPVGVGATKFRKQTVEDLLDLWQVGVIKGNAGELAALAGTSEVLSKGVDSVGSGFKDPVSFVRILAKRERCVVDYISDGTNVAVVAEWRQLPCIIASYCATALYGVEIASTSKRLSFAAITGEIAVKSSMVKGPGTFLPALIDALHSLSAQDVRGHAKLALF